MWSSFAKYCAADAIRALAPAFLDVVRIARRHHGAERRAAAHVAVRSSDWCARMPVGVYSPLYQSGAAFPERVGHAVLVGLLILGVAIAERQVQALSTIR